MLTVEQHRLIYGMLTQTSWTQARQALGVSQKELATYVIDPEFQEAYRKLSVESRREATKILIGVALEVLDVLVLDVYMDLAELLAEARDVLNRIAECAGTLAAVDRREKLVFAFFKSL
jgi:hypothetical protein